jgi:hypothetical protein
MRKRFNVIAVFLFTITALLMWGSPAYGQNTDRTPDQIYQQRLSQQQSAMAVFWAGGW